MAISWCEASAFALPNCITRSAPSTSASSALGAHTGIVTRAYARYVQELERGQSHHKTLVHEHVGPRRQANFEKGLF